MLQSVFVFGSGSSIPDGDGGGENELKDGSVEVYQHCLWQLELLELPKELPPRTSFIPQRENFFVTATDNSHMKL